MTFKSLSREFSHLDLHLWSLPWLAALTHSMGTAARVAVATGGTAVGNYTMIVFTSWDFGCLGDRATKLKQKNIHYQLQVRGDLSYLAQCRIIWTERKVVDMWVNCFQLTHGLLFLSGGSGGGALEEKGSSSDFASKNNFILSTCFYVFSCIWAHYSSLLWHLQNYYLQPGT